MAKGKGVVRLLSVLAAFLLFTVSQAAYGVTIVQDPSNGEMNLYEVINQMAGTSFTSSQDPDLTDLEVVDNDWWHEWDGYINITATYAGYTQNLWWKDDHGGTASIFYLTEDVIDYTDYNFQSDGNDFYFQDITTGGPWYSRDILNIDGLKHMVTYSFGDGVFICAVEDLENLGDHDYNDLVFKISYGAASVNVPAVSYIPDEAVSSGYPFPDINLDTYVRDDDGVSAISWSTSGGTEISVNIDANRVATITYPTGWSGAENITFTATDPDGFYDSEEVTFTVNAPDEPVVIDIRDQVVRAGKDFNPIHLDSYVSHPAPDIGPSDMTWTTQGGDNITIDIDPATRITTINYPEGFRGTEIITFTATINPSSSNPASFTVLSPGHGMPGSSAGSVGGVGLPVDKVGLLIPWIVMILSATALAIVASIGVWKKKRGRRAEG